MGYETPIVERRGPVGWPILNRPEVLNAQNGRMGRELDADDGEGARAFAEKRDPRRAPPGAGRP